MADLIPINNPPGLGGQLAAGGPLSRMTGMAQDPAIKRMLPWFAGLAGLGLLALTWSALSPAPQRVLYAALADGERAEVVGALEAAAIDYSIDSGSGVMSVGEDDLYRARMVVAQQGALAMPESGMTLIDSLPMGASRTLEGDRLRAAQERELQLTIQEIDGVEAVRVHLAQAEKSVFVREQNPPSASVMLRLVRGKGMTESQVKAIANLVSAAVPGMAVENVRIVDQHGQLLSDVSSGSDTDGLELQARTEAKLRAQISQLLTPMLGAGNFSSEISVTLNMEEVTSARETYDKEGAVRSETLRETRNGSANAPAGGVPGGLSNTPPAPAQAANRAPQGTDANAAQEDKAQNGETNTARSYELGREVSVSNTVPGGIARLSVAVALNKEALAEATDEEITKIEELISAAVGASPARGDTVAVITRSFETVVIDEPEFWETPWFATIIRNVAAVLGVLLVLLLAVRPMLKAANPNKEKKAKGKKGKKSKSGDEDDDDDEGDSTEDTDTGSSENAGALSPPPSSEELSQQVELARRIAREQPDDALQALRRMLAEPESKPEEVAEDA